MKSNLALIDELKSLLQLGRVSNQEDICQALEQAGFSINQSKISRLLRKVGAVKTKNEHGDIVYRLPHEPAPPQASDDLSNLVINVACNEALIVVNTSPGAAQLIARIIDYHKTELELLSTLAGDDAIFIAPGSTKNIQDTTDAIKRILS